MHFPPSSTMLFSPLLLSAAAIIGGTLDGRDDGFRACPSPFPDLPPVPPPPLTSAAGPTFRRLSTSASFCGQSSFSLVQYKPLPPPGGRLLPEVQEVNIFIDSPHGTAFFLFFFFVGFTSSPLDPQCHDSPFEKVVSPSSCCVRISFPFFFSLAEVPVPGLAYPFFRRTPGSDPRPLPPNAHDSGPFSSPLLPAATQ